MSSESMCPVSLLPYAATPMNQRFIQALVGFLQFNVLPDNPDFDL